MSAIRVLLITQGVSRLVSPLFGTRHQVVGVLESMSRGYEGSKKRSLLIDILKDLYWFVTGR